MDAELLYLRALEIAQKALGRKHPDTIRYSYNLISCYRHQGKFREAEELEQQIKNNN